MVAPTDQSIINHVEKQRAKQGCPLSSSIEPFHHTFNIKMFFNLRAPTYQEEGIGRRNSEGWLWIILQLFGLGQDGVDIWDGVVLEKKEENSAKHAENIIVSVDSANMVMFKM